MYEYVHSFLIIWCYLRVTDDEIPSRAEVIKEVVTLSPRGFVNNPSPIPELAVSCGLSLLLVLALLRGFFSGVPPSTKINNSKFQFDLDVGGLKHEPPARETARPLPTFAFCFLCGLNPCFFVSRTTAYYMCDSNRLGAHGPLNISLKNAIAFIVFNVVSI